LEGFYYHKLEINEKRDSLKNNIRLLANDEDFEIMLQPLLTGAAAWLVPAGNINTIMVP
jgi:hypothetical protein